MSSLPGRLPGHAAVFACLALPDLRSITPDQMTYSICAQGAWPQA